MQKRNPGPLRSIVGKYAASSREESRSDGTWSSKFIIEAVEPIIDRMILREGFASGTFATREEAETAALARVTAVLNGWGEGAISEN